MTKLSSTPGPLLGRDLRTLASNLFSLVLNLCRNSQYFFFFLSCPEVAGKTVKIQKNQWDHRTPDQLLRPYRARLQPQCPRCIVMPLTYTTLPSIVINCYIVNKGLCENQISWKIRLYVRMCLPLKSMETLTISLDKYQLMSTDYNENSRL